MTNPSLSHNEAPIREVVDAGLLSGAVTMVWQHGEVLQVNEFGYRDVEARQPMARDTVFRIASMTKPVTTAAVMALLDEGKLVLDDPISRWLPEFADMAVLDDPGGPLEATSPAARPMTVEDLLTHRSGLAYAWSVTGPIARGYQQLSGRQQPDSWLADWQRCLWCISPVSCCCTATPPTCSASCWRGSRARTSTRCSPSGFSSRWAWVTPGSSSAPTAVAARRRCTHSTSTIGCVTT